MNSGKLYEAVWDCNLLPSKIAGPFQNTTITLKTPWTQPFA